MKKLLRTTLAALSFLLLFSQPATLYSFSLSADGDSAVWEFDVVDDYVASSYLDIELGSGSAFLVNNSLENLNSTVGGIDESRGMAFSGDYLYVIGRKDDTFNVLDVSDPENILQVAVLDNSASIGLEEPSKVVINNNYAYVSAKSAIVVIDVSDPLNPAHASTLTDTASTLLKTAWQLEIVGNTLFVASYAEKGIQSIDISDPLNLTPIGNILDDSTTYLSGIYSIKVSGDYLYAAGRTDNGFQVVDISDPAAMVAVGSLGDNASRALDGPIDILIDGDYAYVTALDDDGVSIIDISDPLNPIFVNAIFDNSTRNLDGSHHLLKNGNFLYVSSWHDKGIEVINVANPLDLTSQNAINTMPDLSLSGINALLRKGDYLFVSSASSDSVEVLGFTFTDMKPYLSPVDPFVFPTSLVSFSEVQDVISEGEISYQVSTDAGVTWYFWNGTSWLVTSSVDGSDVSTAIEVNNNIESLDSNGGNFMWRAYLESDGSELVSLSSLEITSFEGMNIFPEDIYFKSNPELLNTFDSSSIFSHLDNTSYDIATSDLNGDGYPDMHVTNYSNEANSLYISNGDGNYTRSAIAGDNSSSTTSIFLDVNGDGNDDLLVGNWRNEQNKLFINGGSNTFSAGPALPSSSGSTYGLTSADVDGDGDLDVFVSNWDTDSSYFLINDGVGNFTRSALSYGQHSRSTFIDVDGDGDEDLFASSSTNIANTLWVNDGSGNFTQDSSHLGYASTQVMASAAGDLDGDGDLDLVLAVYNGTDYVLFNDGSGGFSKFDLGNTSQGLAVDIADINNDGNLDFYIGAQSQNEVWINTGNQTFAKTTIAGDSSISRGVRVLDYDNDGRLDLLSATRVGQNLVFKNSSVYVNEIDVLENAIAVSGIGTVDVDSSDVHSYLLVSGGGDDDNVHFTLTSTGKLSFTFNPDFETPLDDDADNVYKIRIETNDGEGGFFQKAMTVSVGDIVEPLNSPPTAITLSSNSVNENNTIGEVLTLSTLDINSSDSHIYSLTCLSAGANDTSFSIVGNELHAQEVFDFETKEEYNICILVDDGEGGTFEKNFTISINNIDESLPVITLNGDSSITLYLNESYTELGATAQDIEDGDLSSDIVVSGDSVDTTKVDQYDVYYDVSDTAGNNAVQVIRTISVVEEKKNSKGSKRISKEKIKEIFGVAEEKEETTTPVQTGETTESNPFGGETCTSNLIVTDNMKKGDRDNKYSSYNKGTVTQVHLIQSHINRLLSTDYGQKAAGPIDGIYGSFTKRGVSRLQQKLNQLLPTMTPLVIDGIVGRFTKKALNTSC